MSVLSRSRVMRLAPVFLLLACDPPPTAIPPGPAPTVAPPAPERPTPPPSTPVTPPAPIDQPTDAGAASAEPGGQPASAQGAVGAVCDSAADCQTGVCEGEGCGPKKGRCAAKNRACTRDRRPYCGCDGNTFYSSGSCPGARFSSRSACTGGGGTGSPLAADGAACAAGADCKSGICEGQGCGDAKGVCMSKKRACTADLRAYCGCDGVTFRSSSSCPGRRFAARGECKK